MQKVKYITEAFNPMVMKRAIRVAFIVGLILNLINQWASITSGFKDFHVTQFLLTFMVPYLVSSYSSVLSKFNFVSGEVASYDAHISCKGCGKASIKVQKGDLVPYCPDCETKTKWKILELLPPETFLEEDKTKSNALFAEFNPAPVMRVDKNGHILKANSAALMLFKIKENNKHIIYYIPELKEINFNDFILSNRIKTLQIQLNSNHFQLDLRAIADLGVFHIYASKNTALITERNQRVLFQNAIEKTTDSVMITDKEGNIEYVNSAFEQHSGYRFDEVKGKNPRILKSGHQSDEVYREMWESISQGNIWKGLFNNLKKNGEAYWEKVTMIPVTHENGYISHYMAIKDDVTEELKLKEQINSFALFARHNPDPVLRFNCDFEIKEANPAATSLFDKETIVGLNLAEMMPELKSLDIASLIKEDKQESVRVEVKNEHYQLVVKGVKELDLCHVYGSNITMQVDAEKKIESMALFARYNPAPVLRFNRSGIIKEANPASAGIFKKDTILFENIATLVPETESLDIDHIIQNEDQQVLRVQLGQSYYQFVVKGVRELDLCHVYGSDITSQVAAEKQMESMALFAQLNPEPVFRFNKDFTIVDANPAAKKTFGTLEQTVDIRKVIEPFADIQTEEFISQNGIVNREEKIGNHVYRFMLRGISQSGVCQVYTSDITKRYEQEQQIKTQAEKIQSSIQYASNIQAAVLPSLDYVSEFLPEHMILYLPRDVVSGDFYWIKKIDNAIVIAIADCTGHGVPGAFMSMLGVAFLNEIVKPGKLFADEILNKLRNYVINTLSNSQAGRADGMDMALCIIHPDKKKIQYAGANNPFVLINENGVNVIKADRMPIGKYVKEDKPFTVHEISYQTNDVVYLFSDGLQDQLGGEKLLKYGSKRFKEKLVEIHKLDFAEQREILENELNNWIKDYHRIDDVLVMGFRLW